MGWVMKRLEYSRFALACLILEKAIQLATCFPLSRYNVHMSIRGFLHHCYLLLQAGFDDQYDLNQKERIYRSMRTFRAPS